MQRQASKSNLFFQSRTEEESRLLDEQLNIKMLEERDAGVKKLEQDIRYVHGMFQDIHALVVDQGVAVDNIVDNIERARKDVKSGVRELQSASKSQQSSCCGCSIL